MIRINSILISSVLLSVILVLNGCSPSPPVGYVSGKVILPDGNNPAGLLVRFMNEPAGVGATSLVAEDGTYSLKHKHKSGVPVGPYQIAVTAYVKQMGDQEYTDFLSLPASEQRRINAERYAKMSLVPEKYHDTYTSGLSYEIVEGEQTHDIEISE